ncbi:MAG: hypothetical protein Q9160_001404 [Pyrenula sp. 1 TL-2023]
MNRFLTKKKKDVVDDVGDIAHTKSKKKGKKGQKDVKPEVDLTTVLPSNDEFRTSLLMPNLSARFSMLREQDDPASKLGKANDDSVLFPKRASRLNVFNRLGDIDEASSIDGKIIPPFALKERSNSYASLDDDNLSQAGSVMDRTRPVEANNLFGGRQKIYNVANGNSSSKNLVSPTFGKALYEGDVSPTIFQQFQARAREEAERRADEPKEQPKADQDDHASTSSPSIGFSKNRGTQSSTASGPSNRRTSTAATSIDSQTPVTLHLPNKPKQNAPFTVNGLDRNATIHRRLFGADPVQPPADTLAKSGSPTQERTPFLQSKSSSNVNERAKPTVYASTFRTTSPPPTATPPGSIPKDLDTRDERGKGYGSAPPLSPPSSEGEDATTYMHNVQPEDRGKATAMGLFNKPARQYDDQQFLQRQMQLHESRINLPQRSSPPTTALPSIPPQRSRNTSDATTSSRSQSEQELSRRNGSEKNLNGLSNVPPLVTQPKPKGTFLDMMSPSDEEVDSRPVNKVEKVRHHRNSTSSSNTSKSSGNSTDPITMPRRNQVDILEPIPSPTEDTAADSPTLGPGMGLSGLIRTHLRNDSDRSSLYPPPSPQPTQETFSDPRPSARTVNQPASVHSNPWEYADALQTHDTSGTPNKTLAVDPQPTEHAEPFVGRSWQDELQARHNRAGSTETQREREEFEQELAERRRKVQERLRNVTESNSRSASPVPSPAKPGNAFAMLRQKTSKGALASNPETKAMRMLGLGNATMSSNSQKPNQDSWKEEEERMLADFAPRKPKSPHVPQSPFNAPPGPHPSHVDHVRRQESVEALRSRSATPSSSKEPPRNRSPPTSRSVSRTEKHREDMRPKTDYNRRPFSPGIPPNISIPPRPMDRPHPYERSASAASGRYRAGSRPPPPLGYFDQNLVPSQSQTPGASPRPSPMTPYSVASTNSYDMSPLPIQQNSDLPYARKRSINKGMISEPTFLSSTSTVSLANRPDMNSNPESPPIPVMNPRRRRPTITQTQVGPIGPGYDAHMMPRSATEERSHFSDEGDKKQPRQRQRLRKSSSEGGNLNARARQHAMQAPSPALPNFPRQPRMNGGMF